MLRIWHVWNIQCRGGRPCPPAREVVRMELRIAGVIPESIVDGPGIRFVIFAQGCNHYCPGCQNPHTHPLDQGKLVATEEIFQEIRAHKLLKGVTFSGGEPFLQPQAFAELGRMVKKHGLDLTVYTGFLFEELLALADLNPAIRDLLELTDLLVDGPFLLEEIDLSLPYRGSRNQRLIKVQESLGRRKVAQLAL